MRNSFKPLRSTSIKKIVDENLLFETKFNVGTEKKKKFNKEKLEQNIEFIESEINELTGLIDKLNREIRNFTATRKTLTIQLNNLWAGSEFSRQNLKVATQKKQRYQDELKRTDKSQTYRDLVLKQIQEIDAAMPMLRENEKFNDRLKQIEFEQKNAENERNKISEDRNKLIEKHTEAKRMWNESDEKLASIEQKIGDLSFELENFKFQNQKETRSNSHSSQENVVDSGKEKNYELRQKIDLILNYLQEKQFEQRFTPSSTTNQQTEDLKFGKISADILNKYAARAKPEKNSVRKKKNKRRTSISHLSQMIQLYDQVRTLIDEKYKLPGIPMFQADLCSCIEALKSIRETIDNCSSSIVDEEPTNIIRKFDRQISDEGYRSFGQETKQNSPMVYRRSKSDESNDNVQHWLSKTGQSQDFYEFLSDEQTEQTKNINGNIN